MDDSAWQTDLKEMLAEKGHTDQEIQKIMSRVKDYEGQMQLESIMASIDAGSFDLSAIIAEALKSPDS